MLKTLTITNIVLIDRLHLDFPGGLVALTGETGAGKSILLDSLQLALGARSDAGLVRKGADSAGVTAAFDVPAGHPAEALLREHGIVADDGSLLLKRMLGSDGRGKAFINDQPVSVALLKQVGALFVDIHGQFETHALLDPSTHRVMLDRFAGCADLCRDTEKAWHALQAADTALNDARAAIKSAQDEEEYIRQCLADLTDLAPEEGEIDRLTLQKQQAQHRDFILNGLQTALAALDDADGAEGRLRAAARALDRTAAKAEQLSAVLPQIDLALENIATITHTLESMADSLNNGDQDPEQIDDRIHALRGQARKLNCTVDDLPAQTGILQARLDALESGEKHIAALESAAQAARALFDKMAADLSARRRQASTKLDRAINAELPPLKLDKARFATDVADAAPGPAGHDAVTFLVATNPGADPGPLHKIASGGEMARLMLALKLVMAKAEGARCLVFDEVDQGIGGSTADAVGERLAQLARHHQVLVVTHSPQVAAKAGSHWVVHKNKTTDVRILTGADERREEIARMLSGAAITDEARAAATRLLQQAA